MAPNQRIYQHIYYQFDYEDGNARAGKAEMEYLDSTKCSLVAPITDSTNICIYEDGHAQFSNQKV